MAAVLAAVWLAIGLFGALAIGTFRLGQGCRDLCERTLDVTGYIALALWVLSYLGALIVSIRKGWI